MVPGGGIEPPQAFWALRILSSTVGSEPLGKFSTLLDFSTAYQHGHSHGCDPICGVLNMKLLQFYYSNLHETREVSWPRDSSRNRGSGIVENGYTEYVSCSDQSNRMDYVVACDFVSPGYFSSMGMPAI